MTRHVLETHCTPCCVPRRGGGRPHRAADRDARALGPPVAGALGPARPAGAPAGRSSATATASSGRRRRPRRRARAPPARRAAASRSAASPRATPAPGASRPWSRNGAVRGHVAPRGGARARREAAVAARPPPPARPPARPVRRRARRRRPHGAAPAELAGLAVLERGPPPRRARRDAAVYYDLTAQRPASAVPRARRSARTAPASLRPGDGDARCTATTAGSRAPPRGAGRSLSLETLGGAAARRRRTRPRGTGRPSTARRSAASASRRRDTIALHRQLPYHHALALAPPPAPGPGQRPAVGVRHVRALRGAVARDPRPPRRRHLPHVARPPAAKTPLPRAALELLLEPEACQAHLARARRGPTSSGCGTP